MSDTMSRFITNRDIFCFVTHSTGLYFISKIMVENLRRFIMNILEEFWYGNIEPAEYDISPSKDTATMPTHTILTVF